jgi:hypothetical protein|tara:strand:- start:374 stop:1270 length:897 start_codon:yes stop_codon:yes gene_type:complete
MASSFAALRKNRNSIDRLVQESQKLNTQATTNNNKDTRFWQATVDKAGNGFSIIRFLPESNGEDLPWVRLFSHGFQGPGGWYIENSLTTLNQKDPCGEINSKLWNNGTDTGKEQARKQKRRLQYISNIYIVKDSGNPENEGKVFLYKFGKKIFDKCNEAMQPAFEDETPINPFDFYTGADFKLKIRKVEGYRNYDKSEFDSQSEFLDGDDDELETVWNKQHSLQEFVAPDQFKSYAELETRLVRVLGLDGSVSAPKTVLAVDNTVTEPPVMRQASAATTVEDDVDESLSFFEKLADED